jgi:DNA-binding NarL/FixJ family response regulator
MIDVVIVDDHAVVRSGLQSLLDTADGIAVVGAAADGAEAIELVAALEPDVVLMDLSMPGLDGVAATAAIVEAHPSVAVVVLTSFSEPSRINAALEAGAIGYQLKDAAPDDLIAAVRAAAAGGAPLDPRAARVLLDRRPPAGKGGTGLAVLSSREQDVLRLVTAGLANKQIARRLGIAERTVKAHLTNIFNRIGVTDRTQAALWAQQHLREEGSEGGS